MSGFLYNKKTHQILLIQTKQEGDLKLWSTMGGDVNDGEDVQEAFQRIINNLLNITLKTKDIYPIYDYFHSNRNKPNYVFYAEVKKKIYFDDIKRGSPSWVTFSETMKLPFALQTKQDIVVGERVINAKLRDIEAQNALLV